MSIPLCLCNRHIQYPIHSAIPPSHLFILNVLPEINISISDLTKYMCNTSGVLSKCLGLYSGHDGVHFLCCVFFVFVFVCRQYCQCLSIVHFWIPLWFSFCHCNTFLSKTTVQISHVDWFDQSTRSKSKVCFKVPALCHW